MESIPSSPSSDSPATAGQMPEVVRTASIKFADEAERLAVGMAEHLHHEIPELGGNETDMLSATQASCESNISLSYRLMCSGRPAEEFVVTPEARAYVRDFVSRGISVPVLLRTYRLGHAWIWESWADLLRVEIADPLELAQAIEYSSVWMFAYIDLVSAALVEDFSTEQSQRMRSADQIRTATVREILTGEGVDLEVASQRLGYELRRRHLAMRVWAGGDEAGGLERAAREAAALSGAENPLIVHTGAATLDAWCGLEEPPSDELLRLLAGYEPPSGIQLAIGGGEQSGIAGFRAALSDAREAARIATASATGPLPVTLYSDIELVSLLSADPVRARRFVQRQLGELAADDAASARLRETVLAFLRYNGSSGRAAKELFVHQNTVRYRVVNAEQILGRPVTDDQPGLLCALMLAVELDYGSGRPSQPS